STGREVKLKDGDISGLIPGLTESTYKNTISIEQLKAQTDVQLAQQFHNYIANLSIAKSNEVNVTKAIENLTNQRKTLEAGQNTVYLKELEAEIEDGIRAEEKIEALTTQLKSLLNEELKLNSRQKQITGINNEGDDQWLEQLPAILEKYHIYKDYVRQSSQLEQLSEELKGKLNNIKVNELSVDSLKEDIKHAEMLAFQLKEKEKLQADCSEEKSEAKKTALTKGLLFSILPAGMIILISLILNGIGLLGIGISIAVLVTGGAVYTIINQLLQKEQKQYEDRLEDAKQQLDEINAGLSGIYHRYQVSSIIELSVKQGDIIKKHYELEHGTEQLNDMKNRMEELEDSKDIIYESIMKYMQHFITQDELNDDSIRKLKEEIERRRDKRSELQTAYKEQREALRLQIEKIKWELSTMENNEGRLILNKSKYVEQQLKRNDDEVELEAIKLALNTIKELSIDIHDSFGNQLNQAVSGIIREVTNDRYTETLVDEKLDIKIGWNGNYVPMERLSAGTIEQLYFALRLSVADLLLGKDEVPLLFDDSFALYDDNRVKAALRKISGRSQTIIFSCHKREQELLKEMEIPYHLIDLSN
ncbi:MAG TPA: hypothetical protein VN131_04685, partial [Mobilitalea sp.]|nr:hypothetical protein [Mobilitalea sp.]